MHQMYRLVHINFAEIPAHGEAFDNQCIMSLLKPDRANDDNEI